MTAYDIFNGDADGICALVQLRLAEPRKAQLITGVKRDINLLEKIDAKSGDLITVLDISMRTNANGLAKALAAGADVFYVDHHGAGDIPGHKNLFAVIDTRPAICTSLLVNKYLKGAYAQWAVTAAYGDNMGASADTLAKTLKLKNADRTLLKHFGELINYNAYGRDVSDLHYAPAELYQILRGYQTPLACIEDRPDIYAKLKDGLASDLTKAHSSPHLASNVVVMEDAAWARRVSGNYANALARQSPAFAHAILTHNAQGGYTVSVRAPYELPHGAGLFCEQFPTGGGREMAGGINHLPADQLQNFLDAFEKGLFADMDKP